MIKNHEIPSFPEGTKTIVWNNNLCGFRAPDGELWVIERGEIRSLGKDKDPRCHNSYVVSVFATSALV